MYSTLRICIIFFFFFLIIFFSLFYSGAPFAVQVYLFVAYPATFHISQSFIYDKRTPSDLKKKMWMTGWLSNILRVIGLNHHVASLIIISSSFLNYGLNPHVASLIISSSFFEFCPRCRLPVRFTCLWLTWCVPSAWPSSSSLWWRLPSPVSRGCCARTSPDRVTSAHTCKLHGPPS